MARKIVASSADPTTYCTVVWFSPVGAAAAMRRWLGGLDVAAYLPQAEGDLACRLSAAFARHFGNGARRVVIVDSDCPDVNADLVSRAFACLSANDLVIGPASDGGYDLIGLNAPQPDLFRNVRWSTDAVFEQTVANAARLGLVHALLPMHRDVDTAADARALGLLGIGRGHV